MLKKRIQLGMIMDSTFSVRSVLHRVTQYSTLASEPFYIFIQLNDDAENVGLDTISKIETVSTECFNEKIPVSVGFLNDPEQCKNIKRGNYDFEQINLFFFSESPQIFECFKISKIQLLFIRAQVPLLNSILKKNVKIVKSIAMSVATGNMFADNRVHFKIEEFFKEKIECFGDKDITLIIERPIRHDEISDATYHPKAIQWVMDKFFTK